MTQTGYEKSITTQEAATRLAVKITTVRAWIRAGLLVATDIGGYKIKESDLEKFLAGRTKRRTKTNVG